MKTFNQFIKEANYIQERLDATVYGQLTLGATPGTATDQQIKSGVSRAIKNVGKKEGSGKIGTGGSYGIKPSGYVSLNYEKKSGGIKPPPTTTTPTTTRTTPTTTTTTTTPTTTRTTPTTTTTTTPTTTRTTPTNTPTKPSGGSTPIRPKPIRPIRPIRPIANNSNRSSGGSANILQKRSM